MSLGLWKSENTSKMLKNAALSPNFHAELKIHRFEEACFRLWLWSWHVETCFESLQQIPMQNSQLSNNYLLEKMQFWRDSFFRYGRYFRIQQACVEAWMPNSVSVQQVMLEARNFGIKWKCVWFLKVKKRAPWPQEKLELPRKLSHFHWSEEAINGVQLMDLIA